MANCSASALGILRTQIGARVMLSSTVRCGNRLNCWNTMPTSERICSMLRVSLVSSTPSTMIGRPDAASRRLMQRIQVDLPEPDGPSTTTTSCSLMFADTPFSAWKSPYHLSTPVAHDDVVAAGEFLAHRRSGRKLMITHGSPTHRSWWFGTEISAGPRDASRVAG